ncbi:MAG: M20/M25/M40 family metallo-hydrolase [Armatimonadota bacterium]|nr:M20/M25/M40 family metallo-hydrolase [Armatimonadota bacterium]MDR5701965.1 M20/M25/M40 family metallo-hydrolase [Armatimonadota bacterium]
MKHVLAYITDHRDRFVHKLQRLCRQPSISAQGVGLVETAHLLVSQMEECGIPARLIPIPGGPPLVYSEVRGRSSRTLLFYNHYDVQPPEPLEEWESDPFSAEIRSGNLYARGAVDTKGNIVARMAAVEAWLRTEGELPCTVKFLVEGEEEIGSPHLPWVVREHRDLVQADACIWESGSKDHTDTLNIYLGVKGICYIELEAEGANRDLHSSMATIVPNPAWRLVWALSTFKDPGERIRIEGFYDRVVAPAPEELNQLRRIAESRDEEMLRRDLGIDAFLLDQHGLDLLVRHLYEPTCTICGLVSGYTGQGSKTVLPRWAMAKVDFRLVPNQDAEEVLGLIKAHLARYGFEDIKVRPLGIENPAKTPFDAEIVQIAVETAREVYQKEPFILPLMAATGPMHVLCTQFGTPAVGVGVGYAGANIHAPNENLRLRDFFEGIMHIALILERFGERYRSRAG